MMIRPRFLRIQNLTTLGCSVFMGIFLALCTRNYRNVSDSFSRWAYGNDLHKLSYLKWLESKKYERANEWDDRRGIPESDYLLKSQKILCWVMVSGDTEKWYNRLYMPGDLLPSLSTAEAAITDTWGKRCDNIVLFALKETGDGIPIHQLHSTEKLDSWSATHEAIRFISKDLLEDYDWFFKIEEDTYVIMENLAYYLSIYDSSQPHYFGHTYQFWGQDYQASGSGIVLSQAALRKLNNYMIKGGCTANSMSGDAVLGRCLSELGIQATDTRDSRGRGRFLFYQPEFHLIPGNLPWTSSFWTQSKFSSPEVCFVFLQAPNAAFLKPMIKKLVIQGILLTCPESNLFIQIHINAMLLPQQENTKEHQLF